MLHHLQNGGEKPTEEIEDDNNDVLLTSWLLRTMKEEMLSSILDAKMAYQVWTYLEEQLLPTTIKKEGLLKNMLVTIKKGSRSLDAYLKDFKSICDKLLVIKKAVSGLDKVFQFAHGLGPKFENFRLAMMTKPPNLSFKQFVLALQRHE